MEVIERAVALFKDEGIDGERLITTNEEGKITGELYSVEPQPGGTS